MPKDRHSRPVLQRVLLNSLFACFVMLSFLPPMVQASSEIDLLRVDLMEIINDQNFQSAHVGIAVQSVKRDIPFFQHNERKRFISASNMKLYTSAAALLSLSPDFTYETKLVTDGHITQGVLKGNLIITASGDPTISGHFNSNNPTQVFEDWADVLIQKGIQKIEGDIIVDNTLFIDSPFGTGWHWDDMSHCYSAPRDAFSFNNNCIALTISPGDRIESPALIVIEPATNYVTVSGNIITTGKDSRASITMEYIGNSNTIAISGTIPLNHENILKYMAVKRPADFGAHVLKEILIKKGVETNGSIFCSRETCNLQKDINVLSAGRESTSLTTLAVYRSPKLSEIIKVINGISNNLYAENVLLTIAKENQKSGNAKEAILTVKEIFKKSGLNMEDLHMADGSGLSRFNLITPYETVQLLLVMARGPYKDDFYSSLAAAGEKGTLKNRRRKQSDAIPIDLRAKTGTMTHVRNLSGYITTGGGELLAFSFLCNNHNVSGTVIDSLFDKLLERLKSAFPATQD